MMPPIFIIICNLLLEGPHIIDHIPDIIICYLPLIFWHFAPTELGFVKMLSVGLILIIGTGEVARKIFQHTGFHSVAKAGFTMTGCTMLCIKNFPGIVAIIGFGNRILHCFIFGRYVPGLRLLPLGMGIERYQQASQSR